MAGAMLGCSPCHSVTAAKMPRVWENGCGIETCHRYHVEFPVENGIDMVDLC